MSRGRLLLALGALGLMLRVGYASHVYFSGVSHPAMDEYETIARQLVAHGRYDCEPGVPTAAREPAYPFFIALVYVVAGLNPYAIFLAHALLGLLTCVFIRLTARRVFGETAGDVAFAISLFYPYFIFYTGYTYRETFLCFAVSAALFLLGRLVESPGLGRAALAGGAVGLCSVTLSTWVPVCAVMGAWTAWNLRNARRALMAFLLIAALLPSAWLLRNIVTFRRFIPGSTLGGFNLYTALIVPEDFRGTEREHEFEASDPHWSRILAMSTLYADDGHQQEAFVAAAGARIRERPGEYLAHVRRQAVKLWRPYPYPRQYQHSYVWIKLLSLISDGWLIPLGFWGLWIQRKKSPELALLIAVPLSATAVCALISAILRYRLPLMIPLIIASSAVIGSFLARRSAVKS